jgi:hypothetical protein
MEQATALQEMYYPFFIESKTETKSEFICNGIEITSFDLFLLLDVNEEDMRKFYLENVPQPSEKIEVIMLIVKCITKELHAQLNIPRTNNKISKLKFKEFEQIWLGFVSQATDVQLAKFAQLRAEKRVNTLSFSAQDLESV